MEFDIAAVILGHREGETSLASLRSFDNAVHAARAGGLRVQTIQHLDDPDPTTHGLFDRHRTRETVQILSMLRNSGLARNAAIEAVEAEYVALLDADDIWSIDWLTTAFDYLRTAPAHVIAHPQFHFCFGNQTRILRLPDQESFEFDLDLMRVVDPWNGLGVCRTSIFRSIPLRTGADGSNATLHDWAWNLDTISAGHVHKVIPQTAVFRRVVDIAQSASAALPPVSALSRYDSALYPARALTSVVARDGFLDAISDIDVVQLHRLLLGREPDQQAACDGRASKGMAFLAGHVIRSPEFAARLHRMLDPTFSAADADPAVALSKDWIERRLRIPIVDARPEAMARSALAATLATFPFQILFSDAFGQQAADLRERVASSANALTGNWDGYIDRCSGDLIDGWVLATGRSGPVSIAVRIGGVLAGVCEASRFRGDVSQALGNNGICGFELVPVIDWNQFIEPTLRVTLHDVETGDVIPLWKEITNQRRHVPVASGHRSSSTSGPPDVSGFPLVRVERYDTLLSRHRIPAAPLPERFLRKPPTVTIVIHADPGTVEDLDATLQSVIQQSYSALQVVVVRHDKYEEPTSRLDGPDRDQPIRMATVYAAKEASATFSRVLAESEGSWLCFVRSGCVLDPAAITWFVHVALRFGARIVYADDVMHRFSMAGVHRCQPQLKPSFDYDLLLQSDYISDVFFASRPDLAATEITAKLDGATRQYDLLLQLLEHVPEDCVFHVPLVLHAQRELGTIATMTERSELLSIEQRHAVERHLLRTGAAVMLREIPDNARLDWAGSWLPQWSPTTPRQRLAIIIPTRDRVELLKTCVESLQSMMADPASCEILIMDNGSEDPATLDYLDLLRGRPNSRVIRSDGPFNWSALNNAAATHTDAELLLLANNDIEVFTEGFDDILRGLLQRAEVGAVGTLLLYPTGAIQHAGTAIGIGGVADHIGAGRMPADKGIARIARFQRSVGAVTGAFLAIRRATFQQVGGFDEAELRIAFSDVDLCLKIAAAGLRIIYTPRVLCLHHESASRGQDSADPEKNARANEEIRVLKERWRRRLAIDTHYNIGYDRSTEPFTTVRMPNAAMVLDDLEHQMVWKRVAKG